VKGLTDAEMRADLAQLPAVSEGAISIEPLSEAAGPEFPRGVGETHGLRVRRCERTLASGWRVSSYSGLVAGGRAFRGGPRADFHPASRGLDYDDSPGRPRVASGGSDPDDLRVLLHSFPAGAGPGTLIHEVFEAIDFASPEAPTLEQAVDAGLTRHGLPPDQASVLCAGIREVLATSLGGPLGDFSLGALARGDRVDEMEFTLPVANSGTGPLTPAALADAFAAHGAEAWRPGYVERLRGLGFLPLRGHLRGFIDLTFRHDGCFYLVDYKSNHLGVAAGDYGPDALKSSMEEHDYVLQYHLYTVALHRHLMRRLPGYDFDTHMGGAYYLFVRGMSPDAPRGRGIFYERPSRALIEALSASLGEESPAGSGGSF
jgi:exodeoxyribonuclease V beta subunit